MTKINNNTGITDKVSDNAKNPSTITAEAALQMLKDGKIKPDSLQISEKGVATFQDLQGNSFRTELSKEQINIFENKKPVINLTTDKVNFTNTSKSSGSATTFNGVFDDIHDDKKLSDLNLKNKKDDSWKFTFQFGFNRTKYFDTDMHLKSSRIDATIKDFSFKERTSDGFYNPKNWEQPMDALRWIDEPTNSFIFNAEKNNNVLYLTAFHPKFLKQDHQTKHVTGTVDGVKVDKMMPINEEFDGYNNQPGEMHMTRFENTHMQMDWQLGYGRNITIFDANKAGKLVYTPSIHAGVTSGQHYDVYVKPGKYWEFDDAKDKNKIQGANFAVGNRLKYEVGKANIFVENRFNFSHLKHQFMDGTAEYNMKYTNTTFGIGYQFYQTKPKKVPQE